MLMDISSEMIHALVPLYLVVALGTSALTVGLIEGIAEATALITKSLLRCAINAIASASACLGRAGAHTRAAIVYIGKAQHRPPRSGEKRG
jgi:hypothetical protein